MGSIPGNYLNDFMSAIRQGDSNTVTDFLKDIPLLVNVNAESHESTPLYIAVQNGHTDIIKILIDHGANVHLLNERYGTLIDTAVRSNGEETVEICRILVDAGVDVNQSDMFGFTPMHRAIRLIREDVARALLQLGADANSKMDDDTVLLHHAVGVGAEGICELLVERGGDLNAEDNDASTPLIIAAKTGFVGAMEILLNSGADIDGADQDGNTALHYAAKFDQARAVLTLIENGADVNAVNNEGERAFDAVADEGWSTHQLDLLKMLIATNEGDLEDLGIITDINEHVLIMMKYGEEVQRMRSSVIDNTNVTFHDILTKSVDQIALYLRNASVLQALRLKNYYREFPEYAYLIEGRINRGLAREELLDVGRRFFLGRFSEYQDLVYKYSDKIMSYLSNRDLTNLKGAWSSDNSNVTNEKTL